MLRVCVSASNHVESKIAESPHSEYSDPIETKCDVPKVSDPPECNALSSHAIEITIRPPDNNGSVRCDS